MSVVTNAECSLQSSRAIKIYDLVKKIMHLSEFILNIINNLRALRRNLILSFFFMSLYCHERIKPIIIEAYISSSSYPDDLFNIDIVS